MKYVNLPKILPCLFAIFIDMLAYGLVYPIIATLFTDYAVVFGSQPSVYLRDFYLGLSYFLYPFCMFFGAPFLGDLSDFIGRRKTVTLCMIGIGLSFFLMGIGVIFKSIFLFLLGRAVSGLMAGSQPVSQAAITDLTTNESRALNMSLVTISINFGIIIGPLIGGIFSSKQITQAFNLDVPFFIACGLAIIAAIWVFIGFRETFVEKKGRKINFLRPIQIFIEASKDKRLMYLAFIFFLMQVGISLFLQFCMVQMKENFDYSILQLGLYMGALGVINLFTLLVMVPIILKKFREANLAKWGLVLQGAGQLGFLIFFKVQVILWLLLLIIGPANIIAFTLMMTFFSHNAKEDNRGWAMGIFGSTIALAFMGSGLITNLIYFVGPAFLIFFGGLLGIFSAFLMQRYLKKYEPEVLEKK